MISRRVLLVLVLALPILVVTFGVLAGASLLAAGMQDQLGARALRWVSIAALLLLAIDGLLLLAALGIRAVEDDDQRRTDL